MATMTVLTVPQVAEELQISPRTVERLIQDGSLESVKVGRRRLVLASQLRDFLDHRAMVEKKKLY